MEEHVNKEVVQKQRFIYLILIVALSVVLNIIFIYSIKSNFEVIDYYKNKTLQVENENSSLKTELEEKEKTINRLEKKTQSLQKELASQPK